jgi:rhodanese-related sulfurtransferase
MEEASTMRKAVSVRHGIRFGLLTLVLGVLACGGTKSEDSAGGALESTDVRSEGAATETAPGHVSMLTADELLALLQAGESPVVLDVRTPEEYDEGHVAGAINIPHDQIGDRLAELEAYRDQGLVVYCRTGRRAGVAEAELRAAGFDRLWDLEGHMVSWVGNELPLEVSEGCC